MVKKAPHRQVLRGKGGRCQHNALAVRPKASCAQRERQTALAKHGQHGHGGL
ncbi:MAG: hypothetical protein ACLRX3_05750 [Subdoligranulum sp.]